MWNTVTQISTAFALTAFIAAAALAAYRAHLKTRLHVLETVPDVDRAAVLTREVNAFGIDANNLTPDRQFDLAVQQLRLRGTQFLYTTIIIIVVALLSSAISAYSLSLHSTRKLTPAQLSSSPLVVDTISTSRTRDLIDPYTLVDAQICDHTLFLLSKLPLEDNDVYTDPHGNKFPLSGIFVMRIDAHSAARQLIGTARIGQGTIDCDSNDLRVFINYKVDNGQYEMDGNIYTRNKNTLVDLRSDPQFTNKNWGWFPRFIKHNLYYFSYDGYYIVINNVVGNHITPQEAENEYHIYQIKRSDGILPNTHNEALDKIIAYILQQPNSSEVTDQ